jgi:hypothetical protein
MTRIIINKDKTEAVVYRENLDPLTLYHGDGKVMELILWYILPSIPRSVDIGDIERTLVSSMEDTNPLIKVG